MPLFRYVCTVLLLVTSFSVAGAQDKASFPTNDEVSLRLTQAERAVRQYKPLIDEHERLIGKTAHEAAVKDRQVISALEMGIKTFRQNPQGFNGPLGFAFFEWIDDADRNALLCASGAMNEAAGHLLTGNTEQAKDLMQLAQSCSDAATLLYTVSENAGSLYTRYVEGEENLAQQGAEVAQQCAVALKNLGTKKNQ